MAVYTKEIATEFTFTGIIVYRTLCDGVQTGWEIRVKEGYVFYDTTANNTELNEETELYEPVIYYYVIAALPMREDMVNFRWVAVPRDSVDENYIFGTGENDHVKA